MKKTLAVLILLSAGWMLRAGSLNPVANPAAVVTEGNARFTVLTDRLIRMEWSADGVFEDSSGIFGPTRDAFDGVFTNGVVGGGIVGNGRLIVSNDVVTSYVFATGISSEMWVVPTSSSGHGRPFSSMASGTSGYGWSVRPEDYYAPSFSGTSWSNAGSRRNWQQPDPPAPRHLSSSTGRVFLLFTDGSQRSTWDMSSYVSPSFPRGIGLLSYTSGDNYMNGLADELRIRACESSAVWHRANYLAQRSDVPYCSVELTRDRSIGFFIILR